MTSPGDDPESDESEETASPDEELTSPDSADADEVNSDGPSEREEVGPDPDDESDAPPGRDAGPGREEPDADSPPGVNRREETPRRDTPGDEPTPRGEAPGDEPAGTGRKAGGPGRDGDAPGNRDRHPGRRPADRRPPGEREPAGRSASDAPGAPSRDEWRRERERRPPAPQETDRDEPSEWALFAYDIASSVLAVAIIGAYLFAVSGVWPPLVAVESGSMEPNMQVNDLVFVMEENRFPGDGAQPSGVVTAHAGQETDYRQFDGYGDVIVYTPDGNERATPIIHRAMFWVEEGENWCRKADPAYLSGLDPGDEQCTAEHSGFITKGDNNGGYDQARGLSGPVKPEWVVGTAEFRVPGLGWIRLQSA